MNPRGLSPGVNGDGLQPPAIRPVDLLGGSLGAPDLAAEVPLLGLDGREKIGTEPAELFRVPGRPAEAGNSISVPRHQLLKEPDLVVDVARAELLADADVLLLRVGYPSPPCLSDQEVLVESMWSFHEKPNLALIANRLTAFHLQQRKPIQSPWPLLLPRSEVRISSGHES